MYVLPPPQAFLIFFLSEKSDWETGRQQKGASGSWKRVRSSSAGSDGKEINSPPLDSLRPSLLVNYYTCFFHAGDWGRGRCTCFVLFQMALS